MKKSVSIWSFHGDWSLKEKFSLARRAGFAGIEIDLTEDGPINFKTSSRELTSIRRQAEKFGLQLSGLATGLYWTANGGSRDGAIREKTFRILSRQIACAGPLGIDAVLVVPATVGADFIPNCEIVPYAEAYAGARALINRALPLAEKAGVILGIENVWNKFLLSPLEMRDFIDQFQSGFVGAYFDVGNVLATGYPEDWIQILAKRIARLHVKDYRRNVGTIDGFVDLLAGDVNWKAVVRALQKVGYSGWCTAEMIPPIPFYRYYPETLLFNTSRALDSILEQV